ncbi:MAG: transposase [Planctomycetes bacterium]|nr:transposase [Planctomycetota bacterium]MCH9776692.1 transposase [Planctomycetota bacterium]
MSPTTRKSQKKRERRVFSAAYKSEAVKLVTEQGYTATQAARSLGVGVNLIHNLRRILLEKEEPLDTNEQEELKRLREENKRLRMERDILPLEMSIPNSHFLHPGASGTMVDKCDVRCSAGITQRLLFLVKSAEK